MKTRLGLIVGISTITTILGGCSGKPDVSGMVQAHLERASSCQNLEVMLKADARAKINAFIDGQIESLHHRSSGIMYDAAATPGAQSTNAAQPPADRASTFSKTNTQVDGVDEADIVKNDDKYIYVLHGSTLQIIDAFPADKMAKSSSATIDGTPSEMFVAGNEVVVFSTVSAGPVFAAAGVARKPHYGYYGGGWWGGEFAGPMCMGYGCGSWVSDPITKITVLSLDGTTPSVARELYFEGSYVSSRRIGSKVRAITSGGAHSPELEYWPQDQGLDWSDTSDVEDAYERGRARDLAKIDASTWQDWVPARLTTRSQSGRALINGLPTRD